MGLVNSKTKSKMNKRLLSNSPGPLWFLFFFFFQNCSQSINNLISQIPTHPRNKSLFPRLNISRYCWFFLSSVSIPVKGSFLTVSIPFSKKLLPKNTLRYSQGMLYLSPARGLHWWQTQHNKEPIRPKRSACQTLINKIQVLTSPFSLQNFLFGSCQAHFSHDLLVPKFVALFLVSTTV